MNNLVDKFYNKDSLYRGGIDTAADDTLSPILDYGNVSARNQFDNIGNGSTVAAESTNVDGGLGAGNGISANGLASAAESSNANLNLNIGNNSANGSVTISSSDDFVGIIVGLGDLISTLRSVSFEYKAPCFQNNGQFVESVNTNDNTHINNATNNSSSASLRPETKRSNSAVSYLSASSNGESLLTHDLLIGSGKTVARKTDDDLVLDGKPNNPLQQIFSRNYKDFAKTKEKYKGLSYNSDFSFASPKNTSNYRDSHSRSPSSGENDVGLSRLNGQLRQLVECVRHNDKQIRAYYNTFSNFKQKLFFCNQRLVAFKKALVNKIQYLNACANECSNTRRKNQKQSQDQNQDQELGEADFKSYLVEIGKLEQHLGELKGTIEQNNRLIEEIDRRLEEDEKMRSLIRRNQVRRNRAIAKGAAYVAVAVCVALLANVVLKHAIRTRLLGALAATLP